MSLDENLWKALPAEVLDRLVAFLPIQAICKFRVVSKKFNEWILSTEFRDFCAALHVRKTRIFLVHFTLDIAWSFEFYAGENLMRRSFKYIKGDVSPLSFEQLLRHSFDREFFKGKWNPRVEAAEGSLVFLDCISSNKVPGPRETCRVVFDLVTQTCLRLPPLDCQRPYKEVKLAVDPITRGFQVMIVENIIRGDEEWSLFMFDSLLGKWKTLLIPPLSQHSPLVSESHFGKDERAYLYNKMYFLKCGFLISYDIGREMFTEDIIEVPDFPWSLIATSNHILMVHRRSKQIQIWEVELSTKKCGLIAQMPSDLWPVWPAQTKTEYVGITSTVEGCNDCLLINLTEINNWRFQGCRQVVVIFDLANKEWRTPKSYDKTTSTGSAKRFGFFIDVQ